MRRRAAASEIVRPPILHLGKIGGDVHPDAVHYLDVPRNEVPGRLDLKRMLLLPDTKVYIKNSMNQLKPCEL